MQNYQIWRSNTRRVVFAGGTRGRVLVTEVRGMAINGLFCADVLRPLDLVPLTDFTYKYHPAHMGMALFLGAQPNLFLFLGGHSCPHPKGAWSQLVLPNLWGFPIFMHAPFNAERPNSA